MVEAAPQPIPVLRLVRSPRGLARALGVSYGRELAFALHRMRPSSKYRAFMVRKRAGGERQIDAPHPLILKLQRKLLALLQEIYDPPPSVFGHVKDRSIVGNASIHVGRRYVANVDIADFYHSIHFKRIVGMLTSSRYGVERSVAMAIAQLCCHNGRLPVGAATSGIISNIVCGPLDSKLLRLAKRNGLRYSRYVDDITLSATNPESIRSATGVEMFGRFIVRDPSTLSDTFIELFASEGFQLNSKKMWFTSRQARQQVTSLVTNRKLNVTSEYVRDLRGAIHAIERFGVPAAQNMYELKYKKSAGTSTLVDRVTGQLSFFGFVTGYGERYTRLATRFLSLNTGHKLPTPLVDRERSIYQIESAGGSEGTAFHIGDGVFVTAAHVVEDMAIDDYCRLLIPNHYPSPLFVQLVATDLGLDVAVLRGPTGLNRPSVPLTGAVASRGASVCAYGFPQFNGGNSCSQIAATVTASREITGVRRSEVSMPWPHGMSGGPVFLEDGKIAGMVFSGPEHGQVISPFATCFTPSAAFIPFVTTHALASPALGT